VAITDLGGFINYMNPAFEKRVTATTRFSLGAFIMTS